MWTRPYIIAVLNELQKLGYEDEKAKETLFHYYRVVRRKWGFYPNARDIAREIDDLHKAVLRKYDPNDPNQIYIGHLRKNKLRK